MPFCPTCGRAVEENIVYCPKCGTLLTPQPQPTQPTVPPYVPPRPLVGTKNEGLAAVLSVVWSGLGQVYVGRIGRGIGIMVGGVILALISWVLLWIPLFIYWIWNIYDAYKLAKKFNQELIRTGSPPW